MKKTTWIIGLAMLISPAVMADVSLSFVNSLAANTYSSANGVFKLDFTVGAGGVVAMDATSANPDANFNAAVNAWDSASVGTVDLGLIGETFQLTFGKIHMVDRTTGLPTGLFERISLRNIAGGIMGSGGGNGNRIDWTSGAQEVFHIEQTGGGVKIGLQDFSWNANSTAIPNACDLQFIAGAVNNTFMNMTGASNGTVNVSSLVYVIGGGANDLTIREPLTGTHGAGLTGMTLSIAVPEPTTAGLLGLGAISILLVRRFKS